MDTGTTPVSTNLIHHLNNKHMKEKVRAIIILNEITVDCARHMTKEHFLPVQERLVEVRDIILAEMFPQPVEVPVDLEIDWSKASNS